LIIKGLNLLDACLDASGTTIPGKTTLIITSETLEELKLLLAVVNTKLAFFYVKEKYIASSYNQGTTFTKEMINNLPLPSISSKERTKLISLVDCILAAKKRNPEADVSSFEDQINDEVFDLYELSAQNRSAIEADLNH
jgi:adenine-specific DNA-methyltransferase